MASNGSLGRDFALEDGALLGSYQISRQIGRGGTSVVYLAWDSRNDRDVALKVLDPRIIDVNDEVDRLRDQLRLVDHSCPYLIRPYDVFPAAVPLSGGDSVDTLVDISEYIPGETLDPPHLSDERVRPVLAMLCEATRYLETHDIYHRDIKPDNVVVTRGDRRAVLLDLGVMHDAKRSIEDRLTSTRKNYDLVTTRYSSPELLSGDLTPQSGSEQWRAHTIWQLGAILFEAITRMQLFSGMRGPELQAAILRGNPFEGVRAQRLTELEELARTCLARNPKDRKVDWEDFAHRRSPRPPTVVFLYAGGTIGSSADSVGRTLHARKLDASSPLSGKWTARVMRDVAELFPAAPDVDVEWRYMPEEHQILSEEADPDTWNALTARIHQILNEDWSKQYLMGLVVLHGTDTMSWSAPAIQLAFPELPCPVILTGANQAPADDTDVEASWRTCTSDAYRNLVRSVLFLASGGHRWPLVHVVFAGTVCHAVNVQKTPVNRLTLRPEVASRFPSEPFVYRNGDLGRTYAYKFIEGLFVNNFLPVLAENDLPTDSQVPNGWDRASIDVVQVPKPRQFDHVVETSEESPVAPPLPSCPHVLVTAYPSGTVASKRRGRDEESWTMVTRFGLSPHQSDYDDDRRMKLFRVVPETALPLVCLAVSNGELSPEDAVAKLISETPIFRILLGNPLQKEVQRARAMHIRDRDLDSYHQAIRQALVHSGGQEPTKQQQRSRNVQFRPGHFEAFVCTVVAPFMGAGSAPDQFSNLFDAGFLVGACLGGEARETVRSTVESALRHADKAVLASGLAVAVSKPWAREGRRGVEVRFRRIDTSVREYYADYWTLNQHREFEFLRQARQGIPHEKLDDEGDGFLNRRFEELRSNGVGCKTTPVHWYLFGLYKGVVCALLGGGDEDVFKGVEERRPEVSVAVTGNPPIVELSFDEGMADSSIDWGSDHGGASFSTTRTGVDLPD